MVRFTFAQHTLQLDLLSLRSPSLDSALRASLQLSKIAPGDFVAVLNPTYKIHGLASR